MKTGLLEWRGTEKQERPFQGNITSLKYTCQNLITVLNCVPPLGSDETGNHWETGVI